MTFLKNKSELPNNLWNFDRVLVFLSNAFGKTIAEMTLTANNSTLKREPCLYRKHEVHKLKSVPPSSSDPASFKLNTECIHNNGCNYGNKKAGPSDQQASEGLLL